jgi:hypothetical protein
MAGELLTTDTSPQALPAHSPKYKRLTRDDLAILRVMHKAGRSQVDIAEALNTTQPTISKWIATLIDTRDEAKEYLNNQATTLARSVVRNGRPSDHVRVLEGLEVLKPQEVSVVANVLVGMPGQAVPVPSLPTLDATFSVEPDNQALSPVVTRELAE